MKTLPLLTKLREAVKPIIVVQGGGDAGKTVTILQHIAIESTQKKRLLSTVTDQTVPALKGGSLNAFQRYVVDDFQKYIIDFNVTERRYTFWNGSKIEFRSFVDEKDARGSERDILFMNECNSQSYQIFWQLQRKTRKQIIVDYNPSAPFWVHDKLLGWPIPEPQFKDRVQFFRVWHEHNTFLSKEEHERYESISDPELHRVYSRGLTGRVQGLIFGHFKKWPHADLPADAKRYIWGIDYGYTNDPTALVKIAVGGDVAGRRRVGKELSYESGLSAETLKQIILRNGWQAGQPIYSEADPDMINQLRLLSLPVEPAIKGPGSVKAGISKVREHDCYYTADSINFARELSMYQFMKVADIATGRELFALVSQSKNHEEVYRCYCC
jgi:phage terminase large subunit